MRRQVRRLGARKPSNARLRLLTYPMALAQPHATVPLLSGRPEHPQEGTEMHSKGLSTSLHVKLRGVQDEVHIPLNSDFLEPRRWVRGPEELCVASLRRSNNVNRVNTYVATYKFNDPQWAPILLPPVRVTRSREEDVNSHTTRTEAAPTTATTTKSTVGHGSNNDDKNMNDLPSSPGFPPQPPESGSGDHERVKDPVPHIEINHNKLLPLEIMARHVNFSLRHIVQKGHGVYLLTHAQHSVLRPKGLIEQSFVTCAFGIRGERLRTDIVHVGPLNAQDVLEVKYNPRSGDWRCTFDFQKPDVPRGVVAISQVEGYGTWFQRKPMLWQRSRRIGALQSQLGAFAYDLVPPHEVGRERDCEVSLLAPHLRFFGAGTGGAEAVGIIASSQIAQQDRLYLGEFEAPAITALDAVHQLAHASALRGRLVSPARQDEALETLLPISWATRTPPPYVPLEADLPFKLQMSRPIVLRGDTQAYPSGGTVGSPFVRGAPLLMFEYNMHQGVDHYVFDDAPSARPMKWWSQKSNMPYSGYMYFVRSGLMDLVEPAEEVPNPLSPVARRPPLHSVVPPSVQAQRRASRYRRAEQGLKNTRRTKKRSVKTEPMNTNEEVPAASLNVETPEEV